MAQLQHLLAWAGVSSDIRVCVNGLNLTGILPCICRLTDCTGHDISPDWNMAQKSWCDGVADVAIEE